MKRRRFLELAGIAAVSVPLLYVMNADPSVAAAPADSLEVTSSRASKLGDWVAHTHLLYVPLAWFRSPPPGGVTVSTTRTYFHSHEVALTQAQLLEVARGATIHVSDLSSAHVYAIALG